MIPSKDIRMVFPLNTFKIKSSRRYKYLPFSEGSLKVITEGTIKFSDPRNFNDPFDCSPCHELNNIEEYIDSRPDLVQQAAQIRGITLEQILGEKREMAERLKEAILNGEYGGQATAAHAGICSLSRDPLNLLMWAHYSENHTGFVVEFDIPEEGFGPIPEPVKFFELLIAYEVKYRTERPVVNLTDDPDTKMEKQFLIKGKDWSYEQEERVIDYVRKSGIHKYDQKKILNSVIAGMRMSEDNFKQLSNDIDALNRKQKMKVKLYRATPVEGEYALFVPGRLELKSPQDYQKNIHESF